MESEREMEAQAIGEWLMQEAASRREMGEAFGRHALEGFTSDAAVLERAAELIREANACGSWINTEVHCQSYGCALDDSCTSCKWKDMGK